MHTTSSIEGTIKSLLGPENVHAATASDVVSGVLPQLVVEPDTDQQLAAVLSFANETGIAVVPRGGSTKLGWGNPPKRAGVILSTSRLNRILEHAWADLTVTVEAGCTLRTLQTALAIHGQRLAFDGLWPERATIGGVLSTNDSGALRLRFGALRDLIIGVTLALPGGALASSGGKVVKNVAGYDLPKLATGALGTLGVITRAVFRLHPRPRATKTFSFTAENPATMQRQVLAIQDSKLAHAALQIRCASEGHPSADILFEATEAGLTGQEKQLRQLLGPSRDEQTFEGIWNARQDLWDSPAAGSLIAKLSVLPTEIARTVEALQGIARSGKMQWQIVAQATGIATLRWEGAPPQLSAAVQQLRGLVEAACGSLVVLRQPAGIEPVEVWGSPGDAGELMKAVKQQLDPNRVLNPGRFVGGI